MPLNFDDLENRKKGKEEQQALELAELERRKREAEEVVAQARRSIQALTTQREDLVHLSDDLGMAYARTDSVRAERKTTRDAERQEYSKREEEILEEEIQKIIDAFGTVLKEGVAIKTIDQLKSDRELYEDVLRLAKTERGEAIKTQLAEEGKRKEIDNAPVLDAVSANRDLKEQIKNLLGVEGVINQKELEEKIQERLQDIDSQLEELSLKTPEGQAEVEAKKQERLKQDFQIRHKEQIENLQRINVADGTDSWLGVNDIVTRADVEDPDLTPGQLAGMYIDVALEGRPETKKKSQLEADREKLQQAIEVRQELWENIRELGQIVDEIEREYPDKFPQNTQRKTREIVLYNPPNLVDAYYYLYDRYHYYFLEDSQPVNNDYSEFLMLSEFLKTHLPSFKDFLGKLAETEDREEKALLSKDFHDVLRESVGEMQKSGDYRGFYDATEFRIKTLQFSESTEEVRKRNSSHRVTSEELERNIGGELVRLEREEGLVREKLESRIGRAVEYQWLQTEQQTDVDGEQAVRNIENLRRLRERMTEKLTQIPQVKAKIRDAGLGEQELIYSSRGHLGLANYDELMKPYHDLRGKFNEELDKLDRRLVEKYKLSFNYDSTFEYDERFSGALTGLKQELEQHESTAKGIPFSETRKRWSSRKEQLEEYIHVLEEIVSLVPDLNKGKKLFDTTQQVVNTLGDLNELSEDTYTRKPIVSIDDPSKLPTADEFVIKLETQLRERAQEEIDPAKQEAAHRYQARAQKIRSVENRTRSY